MPAGAQRALAADDQSPAVFDTGHVCL